MRFTVGFYIDTEHRSYVFCLLRLLLRLGTYDENCFYAQKCRVCIEFVLLAHFMPEIVLLTHFMPEIVC
jgi:hypothetical protein